MDGFTRINAVPIMPAPPTSPGPPGWCQGGAPGIPPTYVGYEWYNAVWAELRAIILAAGLTPSAADLNQVLAALHVLFVDTAELSAAIATRATPAYVDGTNYFSTEGIKIWPGGLIMQWGNVAPASRTLSAQWGIVFPMAFPNACLDVFPSIDAGGAGDMDMFPGRNSPTTTACTLFAGTNLTEGAETRTFGWRWLAIGF